MGATRFLAKKKLVGQNDNLIARLIYRGAHQDFDLQKLYPETCEQDHLFINWYGRQSKDRLKQLVTIERATCVPQSPYGFWTFVKKVRGEHYTYCLEEQIFVEGLYQGYDLKEARKYSVCLLVNRINDVGVLYKDLIPQFSLGMALPSDLDQSPLNNLLKDIAENNVVFGSEAIERYGQRGL